MEKKAFLIIMLKTGFKITQTEKRFSVLKKWHYQAPNKCLLPGNLDPQDHAVHQHSRIKDKKNLLPRID